MFNTQVFKAGDTRIDVEMLPHDTADAARLYGEMVEKARAEVIGATIREAGANIRVVMKRLASEPNFENYHTNVRVLFSVNGVDYDVKTTQDTMDKDVYHRIAEALIEQVARVLQQRGGIR
jgi:hypothetical protein